MPVSRRGFLESLAAGAGLVTTAGSALAQVERHWTPNWISGQPENALSPHSQISLQPLAQQVRELESLLEYLGEPLSTEERNRINVSLDNTEETAAITELQDVLDRHALVVVTINAESRVDVVRGAAQPQLVQQGTRLFLVKVLNQAGVTAALQVHSPNSQPIYVSAWKDESPEPEERVTVEDVRNRWAEISLYNEEPFSRDLSGVPLQYAILQIYSRDAGQRLARISFDVGEGSEDIGPRKVKEANVGAPSSSATRSRMDRAGFASKRISTSL